MKLPIRPSIRLQLTLLYGGLFFLAGGFLLVLTYTLVGQAQPPPDQSLVQGVFGPPPDSDQFGTTPEARRANAQAIFDERERAREEWLRSIRTQSGIALLLTGTGALALGWLVAGRVLRPIREITTHAQQLSLANLDERIDLHGPRDELRELANTINAMLDRLQAAFDSQRHFSAQVSHELRTPLSIMKAEADVALASPSATVAEAELAARIRREVQRSEAIIDGLMVLARSESTMRDHDLLDLASVTGDMVGEYLDAANRAHVRIELTLDSAFVSGDRPLLDRLVGNLLDNGIRYNEPGGWVAIAVTRSADAARLVVTNSGAYVDEADVARLASPFQRGERPNVHASGYGLGLAIARSVTIAHGGRLTIHARSEGGLVAEAEFLPAIPSPVNEPDLSPVS